MTRDLFEYADYRKYLRNYLALLPHQGYGQLAKIARAISLNPSTLTLVLQEQKDFTPEQANDLCEFLQMTELETEYFLNLVALSRAGKSNLRERLKKHIANLRKRSRELKDRLPPKAELSEEAKAIFYSQWYYSGTRLLTSIKSYDTPERIAERLGISRVVAKRVLDFLVSVGLCLENEGRYQMGPQSTHLESESPLISRHHQNWRLRAIERADRTGGDELQFTSPVSVSRAGISQVRKILVNAIEDSFKIIDPAPCEELACLNIDWIKM